MASTLKFPSRAKKKRRIEFIKKGAFFLVAVLVFLGGVTFLLRYDKLSITDVEVAGTDVLNEAELKTQVMNVLLEKYFYLIPKKNFLFYPKNEIERELGVLFKRISKISVSYKSFKNPRVIVVNIEERVPAYLWCGESKSVETKKVSECYFVDKEGYIFDRAPIFSENVYIVLYGKLLDEKSDPIGGTFLSKNDFLSLSKFIYKVSSFGLITASLIKKDDGLPAASHGSAAQAGDYELELARAGKILFSLKDGTEKNISNLESVLGTDPLKTNLATKPDSLEYIDLRFGNKVFFKFR